MEQVPRADEIDSLEARIATLKAACEEHYSAAKEFLTHMQNTQFARVIRRQQHVSYVSDGVAIIV